MDKARADASPVDTKHQVEDQPSLGQDPGAGAARRAALGNAQHVIDGDMVGRDKLVFQIAGERPEPIPRISPLVLDRVRHTFVDPSNWESLRDEFRKRRTVVLRGTSGQGRTATAIRLLASVNVDVIYELDARVELGRRVEQLTRELGDGGAVEGGAAFVLSQPSDVTTVHGRVLRDLDEVLARTDGRLILTVGHDTRLPDEDAMGYLIELPAWPDLREIVHRHLEWRVANRVPDWSSRPEIVDVLDEFLPEIHTCERAALLGRIVSDEITDAGGTISPDRVRARMVRQDLDNFDTWFADLGDVWLRSFAIALAVLDGLPYEDVARAAEKLSRTLDPPHPEYLDRLGDGVPRNRPRLLERPRGFLMERLRAEVVEKDIRRPYGRVRGEAVRYRDPAYPRQVLSHVWREHQIHDVVLTWLSELVDEPSEPVLVQAATAIGVISTHSFHHVLTALVDDWAGDPDASKRNAVAYLLRVPARVPDLMPVVRGMVDRWLGIDDDEVRATAIRTLALSWLSTETSDGVAKLERAARNANLPVIGAIADAFIDLLEIDDRRFASGVLATLVAWFDRRETADAASLVFLFIAHDLVADVVPDGPPVPGQAPTAWPGLLRLAIDTEATRTPLVWCWCRTLALGSYSGIAEQVIDSWAGRAERDASVLDAFTRLVRAIGSADARSTTILLRGARRWRDDATRVPLPRAAAAVESVLGRAQ